MGERAISIWIGQVVEAVLSWMKTEAEKSVIEIVIGSQNVTVKEIETATEKRTETKKEDAVKKKVEVVVETEKEDQNLKVFSLRLQ